MSSASLNPEAMSEAASEAAKPPRKPSRTEARRFAMQAIYQWQLADTPRGELIEQYRAEPRMLKSDSEYFADLVNAVLSNPEELETEFAQALDRPAEQLDPIERAILLVGTHELRSHPEIPYRIIINEAVELAKRYGATESHKYINGVMDRLAKRLRDVEIKAGL